METRFIENTIGSSAPRSPAYLENAGTMSPNIRYMRQTDEATSGELQKHYCATQKSIRLFLRWYLSLTNQPIWTALHDGGC